MAAIRRRRVCALLALVVLSTLTPAAAGHAAKPSKDFPRFQEQKAALGKVAILGDLIVVEDVIGNTEKVYLADCMRLGNGLLDLIAAGMRDRGYDVAPPRLVSVGSLLSLKASYRVLQTWEQHTLEDVTGFPIVTPPFHEDTTMVAGEEELAAWIAALRGTWAFEKKKNKPAQTLAELARLRESIGADHAFVVAVVGTKIPFGKQLGQSMLSGLTRSSASVGNITFSASVDLTQYSGTGIRVAMVDCRSGEVLWSDGDHERRSLSEDRLDDMTKDVLKRLP